MRTRNELLENGINKLQERDSLLILAKLLLCLAREAARQAHKRRLLKIPEHGAENVVIHTHCRLLAVLDLASAPLIDLRRSALLPLGRLELNRARSRSTIA